MVRSARGSIGSIQGELASGALESIDSRIYTAGPWPMCYMWWLSEQGTVLTSTTIHIVHYSAIPSGQVPS